MDLFREFFLLPCETKSLLKKKTGPEHGYVSRGQEIFDASQDSEKVPSLAYEHIPLYEVGLTFLK
jgi:isopenicillin N synthase-like dioxygenase